MSAIIGAVAAWLSNIRSRRLLFLMGVMGTFIVTSLFPGLPSANQHIGRLMDNLMPVSVASAANQNQCVGDSAFIKGFKAFFGVQAHYDRYAVVVASGKNRTDAEAKMKKLKSEHPELNLHIGPRACDNEFYPVFARVKSARCWIFWCGPQPLKICDRDQLGSRIHGRSPF